MNTLSFDPDRAFQALEDAAERHAQAEAEAQLLEEMKSVMLAQIICEHADKPFNKAEVLAKADARYATHIEGMVEARRRANRARATYRDLLVLADMRRSQEASARQLTK